VRNTTICGSLPCACRSVRKLQFGTSNPVVRNARSTHPLPFDEWASAHGYDITPAVSPTNIRKYADRDTQAVFDARSAGTQRVAKMLTESTLETPALIDRIRRLPGME
jgi:hypothetical protein